MKKHQTRNMFSIFFMIFSDAGPTSQQCVYIPTLVGSLHSIYSAYLSHMENRSGIATTAVTSICANLQHRSGKAVIPWTDPSDKEATRLRPSALPLSQTDATHPGTNSKSFIIRNQNDFRSWWQSAPLICPKAFSKQSLCHCHHLPTFPRYMTYQISIRL